jgi:uncharacterized peroxidase-related enzyme
MIAWIPSIEEEDAEGELKRIYSELRVRRGRVSNVMKAQSLDPKSIELHLDLYLHLMFSKSPLNRLEREMIAVVVSHLNNCSYCVTHHTEALRHYSKSPVVSEDLEKGVLENVSARTRAMLEYAVKLTDHPEKMLKADVDQLRTAGLSDETILHVNLITSYFNFVNRIVAGLGVQLEDKGSRIYKY